MDSLIKSPENKIKDLSKILENTSSNISRSLVKLNKNLLDYTSTEKRNIIAVKKLYEMGEQKKKSPKQIKSQRVFDISTAAAASGAGAMAAGMIPSYLPSQKEDNNVPTDATIDFSASAPLPPTNTLSGQAYGAPRDGRLHAGQDYDAGPNDPFYAQLGGEVVFAGPSNDPNGYGNVVQIYNKELNVTERIAEGDRVLVRVGQIVQRGTPVQQGTSRTGVFHYEIRKGKVTNMVGSFEGTLNPVKFLEEVRRRSTTNPPQKPQHNLSPQSSINRNNNQPVAVQVRPQRPQQTASVTPNQQPKQSLMNQNIIAAVYNNFNR